MKNIVYFLFGFVLLGILACGEDDNGGPTDTPSFDRTAFLTNYAENIIKPRIANLAQNMQALEQAAMSFSMDKSLVQLQALQAQWDQTYQSWMLNNTFNFGPGGAEGLVRSLIEEIGVWPAETTDIEERISSGVFELDDFKRATRSLAAIEYLIFGNGDDQATLSTFDEVNRADYLLGSIATLKSRIDAVNSTWINSYTDEFIANDGTDVKSSTTLMYNELVRSYETIGDLKIATPTGLIAGQAGPEPELVEAYYSQLSSNYMKLHFESVVALYRGQTQTGIDSIGWDDYLATVEGGDALASSIETEIGVINTLINNLPNDKALQVLAAEENSKLLELEQAFQDFTRLIKSEMSSLLSLAITFSTADGD